MGNEKFIFVREKMFLLLQNLTEKSEASWGKMNAVQMVEHLNDFFNVSIVKLVFPLITPEEYLPRYREFLYSEKEFKENTKAPSAVLGELPLPIRAASLGAAKEQLEETVTAFFYYFEKDPIKKTMHPVFGMLSFDEWIMLHYKHVKHHFRQFNLIP